MRKLLSNEINFLLRNKIIIFLLTLTPALLLWASLLGRLYPVHLAAQIPFFFDLVEIHKSISPFLVYVFSLIAFFLLWLVSERIFIKEKSWIAPLVFSLSPWFAYLTFAGSFYIYLLALVLFAFYGLLLLSSGEKKLGVGIFVAGSILSAYSSLLLLIIYPLFIAGLIATNFISLKTVKLAIILVVILCFPLFLVMFKNPVGLKNIYQNQIIIFSDPGLISAVNGFQGESREAGVGFLTKLTENRYVYLFKYAILKAVKHITPSTFFTPQENLLKFSFSPPILLAFLVPFLYGAFLIIDSTFLRKYLFFSLVLTIPSFLSRTLVDLNRLILLEPVIILVISFGLIKLAKHKNKFYKIILFLSMILVFVQFLVTVFDINQREYPRYERYFGERFELK